MATSNFKWQTASHGDLNEGPQICIMRIRQISRLLDQHSQEELWPLSLVNLATCLEWFARSVVKHLIDYSAERINPDAKILRELKINYGLVLQARLNHFSIGDIVAMSRNFSSFDEIIGTLSDLTKGTKPSVLDRIQESWADMIRKAFSTGKLSSARVEKELNMLFEKRNELVHGSPRYLAYEEQLEAFITRRQLQVFCRCSVQYMTHVVSILSKFTPELSARSTYDNNRNQFDRLANGEKALRNFEIAIEARLSSDAEHLKQFRRAQHAWRTWRNREADWQATNVWGPTGTGRTAIYMGFQTTLSMDRLRSLEAYLRELDAQG